jgi:hypothetical protein
VALACPERFVSEDAERAAGCEMALDVESVLDGSVGIVASTVFTAYYLPLRTKRIERIQWVNELTKGGVRAFTG